MELPPKRLERMAPPHQYDHAPQHAECIVKNEKECKLYRQMSPDESNPRWECVDENFLEGTA